MDRFSFCKKPLAAENALYLLIPCFLENFRISCWGDQALWSVGEPQPETINVHVTCFFLGYNHVLTEVKEIRSDISRSTFLQH